MLNISDTMKRHSHMLSSWTHSRLHSCAYSGVSHRSASLNETVSSKPSARTELPGPIAHCRKAGLPVAIRDSGKNLESEGLQPL